MKSPPSNCFVANLLATKCFAARIFATKMLQGRQKNFPRGKEKKEGGARWVAMLRTSSLYEEVGGVATRRASALYGRDRSRLRLSAPADRRGQAPLFLKFFCFFLLFKFFFLYFCLFFCFLSPLLRVGSVFAFFFKENFVQILCYYFLLFFKSFLPMLLCSFFSYFLALVI